MEPLERRRLCYGPGDVIIVPPDVNLRVNGNAGDNVIIVRATDNGGVEALVDGEVVATSDEAVDFLRIRAGGGDDIVRLEGVACSNGILVNAGAGDDELFGTTGDSDLLYANTLKGGPGDDTIAGGNQADWIMGGNGNDLLRGGGKADLISGDNGADEIHGGSGADAIYAGAGNDTLFGNAGADLMAGQEGDDRFPDREDEDNTYHTNPRSRVI